MFFSDLFSIFLTLKFQRIMNQRFKEITTVLKSERRVYSDADLARILGISRGEMSNVMSGKRPVSKRIVDNLSTQFPEVNTVWLLTGEGEMLKNTSAVAENHSVSIAGTEIKENKINVNADETIASLIAEVAAQRRLTEIALQQNSDLIALLGQRK